MIFVRLLLVALLITVMALGLAWLFTGNRKYLRPYRAGAALLAGGRRGRGAVLRRGAAGAALTRRAHLQIYR